ncbi:LysR substrate-binding domain-containing protein [Bradyrhizobium sp. LHD-71]|uniref:LysR substrate-binding domain-containing protein n=1 Tax=Bradyrhizobium sp. LHD-71 TaxID=3072141 RepID=UPI00280E0DAF|nr:LysR substrate-binding domain-containing protein [Bradyrhizobium sp. LHD-71]MDQ8728689.1 LysR substrate-binding domain-containing protein [Bradyrhizobium sp. LHD-71]
MSLELRHLRYFVTVADELSFTRAAQRLRISQPPLSQQIQDLEAVLKTQLLLRTSRRVELTAAGEALHARAKSILEQVDAAVQEAASIGRGERGRILIGATGSILSGGLADLLAGYRHEFPEVTTTLFEQAPRLQMRALQDKKTDISFIRLRPESDDFASELAWREDVVVAMSSIHRLAGRKRIALKDLRDEEYVALAPESSEFAASIRDSCVAAGFLPRIAHEVVDAQSITGLLAAGFGVALVPSSIARFTTGEIRFRSLGASAPAADVYIVHRNGDQSTALRAFMAFARRFFQSRLKPRD